MILHSVTITNFRSFRGKQTFVIPEEPGLYFMQGINEAEPRLEGNGTGKSTIWEAITWCFWGKTSRGLKAGDICNWEAEKGSSVSIHFTSPSGEECRVIRTWKPNSWILEWLDEQAYDSSEDLTKSTENPLLGWLALEYQPFLSSIMMAQGQPMFLDLKHDQQAALFSEVMGLDRWLDYSTKASKRAGDQDRESRDLERRYAEIKGQIEGQQDFSGSIEQFEIERKRRIKDQEAPYDQQATLLNRLSKGHQVLERDETTARDAYRRLIAKADANRGVIDKQREIVAEARRDFERLDDRMVSIQRQIKFFLDHDECPTCKQTLRGSDHVGGLKKELKELIRDSGAAEVILTAETQALENLKADDQKAEEGIRRAKQNLEQAEDEVRASRHSMALIERELDDIEERVDAIGAEVNPYQRLQEEAQNTARRRQKDLAEVSLRLDASNEAYALYSFWVRGFKELRLQLIAEALTELEIEVNSCVAALGLISWELKFQIDRETKGGSIQRGFSVQVLSPHNPKPVPWEAWSGGESQRLRLAGNMGLANLIRSRSSTGLELEVWDEPSTALSPQGVKDLLEALERRAQVEQRVIWVVDHTAHNFGGFAGGATITKTKAGSTIEQY